MKYSCIVMFILCSTLLVFGVSGPVQDKDVKDIANPKTSPTPTPTPQGRRVQPGLKLSSTSGPLAGGNQVIITGTGFNEQTTVRFGTSAAELVKPIQPDSLTVVVPSRKVAGFVTVLVSTGKKVLKARYQYKVLPPSEADSTLAIIRVESGPKPAFANKETTLRIMGQGFTRQTRVLIEDQSFFAEFVGQGLLSVVIPPDRYSPGPVDINVRNPDNEFTMVNGFTFVGPKIFWVDPNRGPTSGGTKVRIQGQYLSFSNLADVRFGDSGITAGKIDEKSEHVIFVDTPPTNKPGWVDLVVYGANGQKTTLTNAFYYEEERGPSAPPKTTFLFRVIFDGMQVADDGAYGKGNSWSFDIRVNGRFLCDMPPQMYRTDQNRRQMFDTNCRKEIEIEESDVRIRIIGTRGDVWIEGERTVPLTAFKQDNTIIGVSVEGNNRRKGLFFIGFDFTLLPRR